MMKELGRLGQDPRTPRPDAQSQDRHGDLRRRPPRSSDIKAGRVEFRVDKTGIIHTPIGKLSFDDTKLVENAQTLIDAIMRAKPAAAKGKYVYSIYLSSTMGPGISIDPQSIESAAA